MRLNDARVRLRLHDSVRTFRPAMLLRRMDKREPIRRGHQPNLQEHATAFKRMLEWTFMLRRLMSDYKSQRSWHRTKYCAGVLSITCP